MKDIFSLRNKKTILQAILFYIIFTVGTFAVLVLVDILLASIPVEFRFAFGRAASVAVPLLLSLGITQSKKLTGTMYVILIFLSLIGWGMGIFVSMLPTVYLSTLPSKKR